MIIQIKNNQIVHLKMKLTKLILREEVNNLIPKKNVMYLQNKKIKS